MEYKDNMLTYLKWRGDLTVSQAPFNEVDALILAEMSYVSFDGIVPGVLEKESISFREAAKIFLKRNPKESLEANNSLIRDAWRIFVEASKTRRFGDMRLFNYVNQIDYEIVEQFSALHVQVEKDFVFIAFRGTDDNLVGWKENFNMSYMMPVPAQESAVKYVNQTMKGWFRKYWIGGHSKGGNLAIYASTFCKNSLQKKISGIYSFDGPGFNEKMISNPLYKNIQDRISAYVPQWSIVGMLLEHQEKYKIVKSSQTGVMQHDAISWMVDCNSLELAKERDERSCFADSTINAWLSKIERAEREAFVEALFTLLEQAGIHYVSDLMTLNIKKVTEMIKAMKTASPEQREIISKMMHLLWNEGNRIRKQEKIQGKLEKKI